MSDLRFLRQLGAEFERVGEKRRSGRESGRGWRGRVSRSWVAALGVGMSVLVVVLVVAVTLGVHARSGPGSSGSSRGVRIVFSARPLDRRSPLGPAIDRSIKILRARFDAAFRGVRVSRAGNRIIVVAPDATGADRARISAVALGSAGRLDFYDWEADALTPNGKSVASQLHAQAPAALIMSQGASGAAPGEPNAGGVPLYQAVELASKQPKRLSSHNARTGPQYYMFGAPGSAVCAAKATQDRTVPTGGQHCLLAGPDNELYTTSHEQAVRHLGSQLPPGVSPSDGQVLIVQQGTVVLHATNPIPGQTVKFPDARFYVLMDNVALSGSDVTNPRASTDQAGNPDVRFDFNPAGKAAFQNVTDQIAHRGQDVSTIGQQLNQHFAVTLDNQLLTVPSIDYTVYPDGITGGNGADITAGLTPQSAHKLATMLRQGPLPVKLALRSHTPSTRPHADGKTR
jgi:SecD/SecF fusion protein